MKILVAVDASAYSRRVHDYLATHPDWAEDRHAYTVLNVVPPLPHRAAQFVGADVVQSYYHDESERALHPFRALFGMGKAQFQHKVGAPAEVIAELAREGRFDLVIMGAHGDGALKNLVLGSVTTKVLAACTVPVLIVR